MSNNKDEPAELNSEFGFSGHVLVAEDSLTNQILIKLLLGKMGFEVTIAQDGNEAVQKTVSQFFHILTLDRKWQTILLHDKVPPLHPANVELCTSVRPAISFALLAAEDEARNKVRLYPPPAFSRLRTMINL